MRRLAVFVVLLLLLQQSACNSLFYQGDKKSWDSSPWEELHCERSVLDSLDGTRLVTMQCLPPQRRSKAVILQFHGNAQNMSAHHQLLSWMIIHGYTLATFDYRGYGESAGESSREGLWLDARAYIRYARETYKGQMLVFYGQSLGGAVLMRALIDEGLRDDEVYVFEGTFASYQSVARTALARSWFLWPVQWLAYVLVTDNYAPGKEVARFSAHRVLLIHGTQDTVVPIAHGEEIARIMQVPLTRVPGGGHLDTWRIMDGALRSALLRDLETIRATLRHP